MAKYLILIYGDEQKWAEMTESDRRKLEQEHASFRAAAGSRVLGGYELEPASTATTLRANGTGSPVPTDGPFLETKEGLGGYYVLEAADLDEAMSLAGRLPEIHGGHSGVEIRPIVGQS